MVVERQEGGRGGCSVCVKYGRASAERGIGTRTCIACKETKKRMRSLDEAVAAGREAQRHGGNLITRRPATASGKATSRRSISLSPTSQRSGRRRSPLCVLLIIQSCKSVWCLQVAAAESQKQYHSRRSAARVAMCACVAVVLALASSCSSIHAMRPVREKLSIDFERQRLYVLNGEKHVQPMVAHETCSQLDC
jgi:hypothetical protein